MNLSHLKYAVVIAEAGSMSKAAEKLYTAQPNLSRAMRELEASLGITIFERTSHGISPTADGEEFLAYARRILAQVDNLEALYRSGEGRNALQFSVSVPRASYISYAFTEFIKELKPDSGEEIFYRETNSERAIANILQSGYRLGILRYQVGYEKYFEEMLKEKGLHSEVLFEFVYRLLISEKNPLAAKAVIRQDDLTPFTEIAHADPYVPSLSLSTVRRNEILDKVKKHIYVFERASQMELLGQCDDAFMWVSPVPPDMLRRLALVQRDCPSNTRTYRDVLIYREGYALTDADNAFIGKLKQVISTLNNLG